MTTKPKAKKFRIRRGDSLASGGDAPLRATGTDAAAPTPAPAPQGGSIDIDSIRREGLTGRQLRMARRVAQKNGLAVTSDFDAVRQLRTKGIDPFQRNTILELVAPEGGGTTAPGAAQQQPPQAGALAAKVQLPQTIQKGDQLPSTERVKPTGDQRASEIMRIQRDIAKRRRRRLALLMTRLAFFVALPTFIVAWYFSVMATPMYATNSEFVIQQADTGGGGGGAGGLGGLFQGTSMATQQDSITVQSYLASREAMVRLDEDHAFKAHFSDEDIDRIQRLDAEATNEDAFDLYKKHVKISYDPTEGILRMEVIAASPEKSQEFSEALLDYAEEQVDQMTQRPRNAAMAGARQSLDEAEARRQAALEKWVSLQENLTTVGGGTETSLIIQEIGLREQERSNLALTLQSRLDVRRPNEAQVSALRNQIANLDRLIADLRGKLTDSSEGGSAASNDLQLRLAEEDYTFQSLQVQAALTQMEAARIEANKQVRYVSVGVAPIAPDEATYPRAFENSILAFLIFAGVYLMISLTSSILREQVVS